MDNKTKAKYWMKMAEEDYIDAKIDLEHERFHSSVFHSQQCCEKVCKAILAFLGIEPGKTHFPSFVIETMVLRGNKYELDEESIKILEKIVLLSSILESQREFPRYGWETRDRIIMPSEIYDKTKAEALIGNAEEVLDLAKKFFQKFG